MCVIEETIRVHEMRRVQAYLAKNEIIGDTLMTDVVQCVAHAWVGHTQVFVHFKEQRRNESGLPVVAMDDIRVLVQFQHQFERGAIEEGESRRIVVMSIKDATVEEMLFGVRLDKEAFHPVNEPEVSVATNPPVVIRHPQVAVDVTKSEDPVIAHAVVLRK